MTARTAVAALAAIVSFAAPCATAAGTIHVEARPGNNWGAARMEIRLHTDPVLAPAWQGSTARNNQQPAEFALNGIGLRRFEAFRSDGSMEAMRARSNNLRNTIHSKVKDDPNAQNGGSMRWSSLGLYGTCAATFGKGTGAETAPRQYTGWATRANDPRGNDATGFSIFDFIGLPASGWQNGPAGYDETRSDPTSVPEPGTTALLAVAGLPLCGLMRHRRR